MVESAFEIAENAFDVVVMWKARIVHVKTSLLHRVGELGTGESHVLQGSGKTTIKCRIRKRLTGRR